MIFNMNQHQLEELKAAYTTTEIFQQPSTWRKTIQQIQNEKAQVEKFVNQVISSNEYDIILTGAGTSEFVGNSLFSYLKIL